MKQGKWISNNPVDSIIADLPGYNNKGRMDIVHYLRENATHPCMVGAELAPALVA
jgi:hypothetical protein